LNSSRQRASGIALLVVLWATALMSVLVATGALVLRTERQGATGVVQRSEARALADAGVYTGIKALLTDGPLVDWTVEGKSKTVSLGNGQAEVRMYDNRGKIDLNRAPGELLAGLARVAGAESPEQVAAKIVDWRDKDSNVTNGGAELNDYEEAGKYGPANRPFLTTSELYAILELPHAVAQKMIRLSTVYNRTARIDPTTASFDALRSIPGLENLERRQLSTQDLSAPGIPVALAPGAKYLRRTAAGRPPRGYFTIVGRGVAPGLGVSSTTVVTVFVSRVKEQPYTILSWQHNVAW
jgi:general secretion pathway protein K